MIFPPINPAVRTVLREQEELQDASFACVPEHSGCEAAAVPAKAWDPADHPSTPFVYFGYSIQGPGKLTVLFWICVVCVVHALYSWG